MRTPERFSISSASRGKVQLGRSALIPPEPPRPPRARTRP
jgi:hypothetical protein